MRDIVRLTALALTRTRTMLVFWAIFVAAYAVLVVQALLQGLGQSWIVIALGVVCLALVVAYCTAVARQWLASQGVEPDDVTGSSFGDDALTLDTRSGPVPFDYAEVSATVSGFGVVGLLFVDGSRLFVPARAVPALERDRFPRLVILPPEGQRPTSSL